MSVWKNQEPGGGLLKLGAEAWNDGDTHCQTGGSKHGTEQGKIPLIATRVHE